MGFSCIGDDCVEFAVSDYIFDIKFADENCKYYTYVLVGEGYEGVGSDRFTKGDIRILNNAY